mmetsp:Transcript_41804/g.131340  ORF Transcript_41804/g.131340 Transcript_41804/m.131340 type:complete len:171 (+) Transcript_41804:550-1062(+)
MRGLRCTRRASASHSEGVFFFDASRISLHHTPLAWDGVAACAHPVPRVKGLTLTLPLQVVLCIECCGKRGRPEAYEASTKLGSYSDTLSSGGVVLGPRLDASALTSDDLRGAATLSVNGAPAAKGSGAAAPGGGPVEALAWLANHLNGRGLELRAGQLVATGSLEMTVAP